nr:hypothetical protein [Nanoarchaeum sp.]
MLDSFFNAVFGWSININPVFGLFFITLILTLIVTIIYKYATDQKKQKMAKEEMKMIRGDMKKYKEDPKKVMEFQKRAMELSMEQMKNSFKPMLITFIPLVIIFAWLKITYEPLTLNLVGIHSWLLIYIIFSLILSPILRKVMKVY